MNTFSLRIRQLRRDRNMSQEELARKLGISRQAVIAIEQGSSLPSLPVIVALLRVLDIPFQSLFEEEWSPLRIFDTQAATHSQQLAHFRDSEQKIPVELREDAQNLYVTAELAGIREEDVTVDLSPQHILIMAIRRPGQTNEKSIVHIDDISWGPLLRILSLPHPINTEQANAEFNRGLLQIKLPKLLPETSRRITFDTTPRLREPKETYGSE